MKKIKFLLIAIIIFLFITILSYKIISFKKDINYLSNNSLAIMVETEEGKYERYIGNKWPIDNYYFSNSECDNNSKVKWNYETNSVVLTSNKSDNCTLYFDKKQKDFSFTGGIQEFAIPVTGTYKLEVWGAQGGTNLNKTTKDGGLGGYSSGEIFLYKGETLYVVVGGQGSNTFEGNVAKGGFNGGGDGLSLGQSGFGGGGATHIAKVSGELSTLENDRDAILIVAGGGGGNGDATNNQYSPDGGVGGGLNGGDGFNGTGSSNYLGHGGSQTKQGSCPVDTNNSCGSFGHGGNNTSEVIGGAGGGGGFYGGSQSSRGHAGGGGGSGYIGNSLLVNAKTIGGDSLMPAPDGSEEIGHEGNGYAKITLVEQTSSFNFDYAEKIQEFTVPVTGTYKLEVWGAQGGTSEDYAQEGKGGYSTGTITLNSGEKLYIVTGGQGSSTEENGVYQGGFNGGGSGALGNTQYAYGGGGATHIAKSTGVLSSLSDKTNDILIVAGGGGGNGAIAAVPSDGGAGGGFQGKDGFDGHNNAYTQYVGLGATQSIVGTCPDESNGNCGSFGQGGSATDQIYGGAGGGGGYFGGSQSTRGHAGGGGGSGYIGNSNLKNGNTISGDSKMPSPTGGEETGHSGNGFARITLLSES